MPRTITATHINGHQTLYAPYANEFELFDVGYKQDWGVATSDLHPWIKGSLQHAGLQVNENDRREAVGKAITVSVSEDFSLEDLRLLSQTARWREGILLFRDNKRFQHAIKLLNSRLPASDNLFIRPAALARMKGLKKQFATLPRVTVLNPVDPLKPPTSSDWFLSFQDDETTQTTPNATYDVMTCTDHRRCYSIAFPEDIESSNFDKRRNIIYACDGVIPDRIQVYVVYWHSRIKSKKPKETELSSLDHKRGAIWRSFPRNQWVTSLANALTRKHADTLRGLGIFYDQSLISRTMPKVIILVESLEHARELKNFLPGWSIRGRYDKNNKRKHAICTLQHVRDHEIETDIVIRAAGHYGELPELLTLNGKRSLMILDIADNRTVSERDALDLRMGEYHRNCWQVISAAPRSMKLIPAEDLFSVGGAAGHTDQA